MTSLTESFNPSKHTPLYENEQNERESMQWRLLKTKKLTLKRYTTNIKRISVVRGFSSFGILSAFWSLSVSSKLNKGFFGLLALFFGGGLDQSFYFEIDTSQNQINFHYDMKAIQKKNFKKNQTNCLCHCKYYF